MMRYDAHLDEQTQSYRSAALSVSGFCIVAATSRVPVNKEDVSTKREWEKGKKKTKEKSGKECDWRRIGRFRLVSQLEGSLVVEHRW